MMERRKGVETILTATTADLIAHDLPDGRRLVDLGAHRLQGIPGRHRLCRLGDVRARPLWQSPWILALFPAVVLVSVMLGLLRSDETDVGSDTTAPPPETTTATAAVPVPRGELLWTAIVPGGYGTPAVDGIRVLAVDGPGWLAGLDLATGSVLWRNDPVEEIVGAPFATGDIVLIADQRTGSSAPTTRSPASWPTGAPARSPT